MGEFAKLEPSHTHSGGSTRLTVDGTYPQEKLLKEGDPSTIILKFAPGSVARGWCYELDLMGAAGAIAADARLI